MEWYVDSAEDVVNTAVIGVEDELLFLTVS